MDAQSSKNQKTTVKIWLPIMNKLEQKLDAACLRRDAFLAKVISSEAVHLDKEVSIPNSKASYLYVTKRLDALKRKTVTLSLPAETINQINEVCHRKLIVRDSFFNRLFLLLAASPRTIDKLLFGSNEWRSDFFKDSSKDGVFEELLDPIPTTIDPFRAIREMIDNYLYDEPHSGRDRYDYPEPLTSVYTIFFKRKVENEDITGINCYLPDWRIPGTAEAKHVADLDELFANEELL